MRLARRYLAARQRRAELLGTGLFADPAWDMLLDLFVSDVEGVRISVSSACLASGVPSTTALAWLVKLEQRGLVFRSRDSRDRRRILLRISPCAVAAVEHFLALTFGLEDA